LAGGVFYLVAAAGANAVATGAGRFGATPAAPPTAPAAATTATATATAATTTSSFAE